MESHALPTKELEPTTAGYRTLNTNAEKRARECPSAPMPDISHLNSVDYQNVYEPSDDTYLLLDGMSVEFDTLPVLDVTDLDVTGDISILELGCGTGVASIHLALLLRKRFPSANIVHHVTDINADAIAVAQRTASANNVTLLDHRCDLASDLLPTHGNSIDIILFNPPYVPTPDEEVGADDISASWAGGEHGRIVIDRAMPQIAHLLKYPGGGVGYMIVVDDNYPEKLALSMWERFGMRVEPLVRRKARNEYLTVLKLSLTRPVSLDISKMDISKMK